MPIYRVEVEVTGMEYYYVEADSKEEAEDKWTEEEPVNPFTADSYDVLLVEEDNE